MDSVTVNHFLLDLDVFRDRAAKQFSWRKALRLAILSDVVMLVEGGRDFGVEQLNFLILRTNLLFESIHDPGVRNLDSYPSQSSSE